MLQHLKIAWFLLGLIILALAVFATSDVTASKDGVFVDPNPQYMTKTVYETVSFSPVIGTSRYETKTIVERKVNLTRLYPFNLDVEKTHGQLDGDDKYLTDNYDTSSLLKCSANTSSINDIYECTKAYNKQLAAEGYGNCRLSTSAFKIAFLNSPLAGQKNGYGLMKAYAEGTGGSLSAHRFIVLSNKEGNFVIDPFWGADEGLKTAVDKYTATFFGDAKSPNYKDSVYKIDIFY